jgi:hypothetical protein
MLQIRIRIQFSSWIRIQLWNTVPYLDPNDWRGRGGGEVVDVFLQFLFTLRQWNNGPAKRLFDCSRLRK